MPDIGRNDPCHCGSGKKYKKCCEAKDQAKEHTALEKEWAKAEKEFEKNKEEQQTQSAEKNPTVQKKMELSKPSAPKHATLPATPKFNMPRKSGGG